MQHDEEGRKKTEQNSLVLRRFLKLFLANMLLENDAAYPQSLLSPLFFSTFARKIRKKKEHKRNIKAITIYLSCLVLIQNTLTLKQKIS